MQITPIGYLREGSPAAVIGVVLQRVENYVIVDDGTGRARIYTDQAETLNPGDVVLAVGIVASVGQMVEIQSDAVTLVSGIDLNLLKETLKLSAEIETREPYTSVGEGYE